MTPFGYGVTHRGRLLRAGEQVDTWEVEVTALAANRTIGPFESTVPALEAGDRVLLIQVGASLTDLVIVGKLPPTPIDAILPIDIDDVTGLDAALAGKQPLDTDLTTIAGLTATTDSVMQAKAGAWAARTLVQLAADLSTLLQPLDSDLTTIAGLTATTDSVMQAKAGAWSARTLVQLAADLSVALQPLDADLTAIAALAPTNDDIIQRVGGAWTNRTMAQLLTALNPPRAQLRQTVTQSLTNTAFTIITFDTESRDTANAHSTVSNTGRWTFPTAGDAWVSGAVCFGSSNGFKATRWTLSGTVVPGSQIDITTTAGAQWPIPARGMWITGTAGQYIELQGYQEVGVLSTGVSSDVQSSMSVWFAG